MWTNTATSTSVDVMTTTQATTQATAPTAPDYIERDTYTGRAS